eukprot:jgi/Botrbrau1/21413/Bobra.0216s0030.1
MVMCPGACGRSGLGEHHRPVKGIPARVFSTFCKFALQLRPDCWKGHFCGQSGLVERPLCRQKWRSTVRLQFHCKLAEGRKRHPQRKTVMADDFEQGQTCPSHSSSCNCRQLHA